MMTKLISLGLIAGSTILAALIILEKPNTNIANTDANNPNLLPETPAFQITTSESVTNLITNPPLTAVKSNATQKIAKKIGQEILAQNPQKPFSLPNPEEVANDYLAEAMENFDASGLKTPPDIQRLIVIPDNNSTVLENYFQKLIANLNELQHAAPKAELTQADFEKLINAYDAAIAALYQLPVPQTVLDLHQEQISLMNAQRSIFAILDNYETDPAKALLAAQASLNLAKEFNDLKTEIQNRIVKYRLKI